MSMRSKRLELDGDLICECKRWRIEGFISYGLVNKLEGSRASDLATLGVAWEEHFLNFFFPTLVLGS